jgi:hypothetical protein
MEDAGKDGLAFPAIFAGKLSTDEETDRLVRSYLQSFRFEPSMSFAEFDCEGCDGLFVPWEELYEEIPIRIARELEHIRQLNMA